MTQLGHRHVALVLSASLCLASPFVARAQSAAPPPNGAAPAAGAAGGSAAKGGGQPDTKTACRDKAKGQGLRGKEMREAMMDCIAKENPAMAGALKCKSEARDKGMKAGSDDMRAFMRSCRKSKS